MSNELVQVTQAVTQPPPAPYVDQTGFMDVVRLKPGNLKLVTGTTLDPKTAKPGQFLESRQDKVYDKFEVVILKVKKGRVMFPPGGDLKAGPLCRSTDGVRPAENVQQKQANYCGNCPQSVWGAGKQKPACQESIDYLVVMTDSDYPYYMSIRGASIGTVLEGMSMVANDIRNAYNNAGDMLQAYNYKVTFTSDSKLGKKGRYFVTVVDGFELMTGAERAKYEDMYAQLVAKGAAKEAYDESEDVVEAAVGQVIEGEIISEV